MLYYYQQSPGRPGNISRRSRKDVTPRVFLKEKGTLRHLLGLKLVSNLKTEYILAACCELADFHLKNANSDVIYVVLFHSKACPPPQESN